MFITKKAQYIPGVVPTVEYFEQRITVPVGYRFVATDQSGSVMAYKKRPYLGRIVWKSKDDAPLYLGTFDVVIEDWDLSLKEYS